jgi:CCR4-NOT transcription complex subunit 4
MPWEGEIKGERKGPSPDLKLILTSPLCVEEMDISDKNFKPCPCGYQVCQFCYNNIRHNLNGLCPACRRPYSDENVEYRQVSQEEWKQDHMRQTRKEKERRQKEREKKDVDQVPKKHLSGMRVIQKNLVYVIGLNPNIPTEELHNTLRGDQFFGQYGKIQKIVINKRTNANGNPGLGVYVTFARKEDASRCITAVDGSINDGKYLRAAYGTTKYCSSYLRGQPCPNPNCMFLHEPGEEADSYTRQDLSTIQHAARQGLSSNTTAKPRVKSGVAGSGTPVAAHSSPSVAAVSEDEHHESALPPSVSWAQKASPPTLKENLHVAGTGTSAAAGNGESVSLAPGSVDPAASFISESFKGLTADSFAFVFSSPVLSTKDMSAKKMPTLFAFSKDSLTKETMSQVLDFSSILSHFTNQYGGLGDRKVPAFGIEYPSPEVVHATTVMADRQQASHQQQQHLQNLPIQQNQLNADSDFSKTSTPPPGLFSSGMTLPVQNQNSQELLAHLMNGSRGENNQ